MPATIHIMLLHINVAFQSQSQDAAMYFAREVLPLLLRERPNLTFTIVGGGAPEELRRLARAIPLERTLIETDSPFLAPVPLRGRRNEPAFVRYVAACIGALHGLSEEETCRITGAAFRELVRVSF